MSQMNITLKELVLKNFDRTGITLHRETGDLYRIEEMLPSYNFRQLRRAPGFSAFDEITYATDVYGCFYDVAQKRIIIVGLYDDGISTTMTTFYKVAGVWTWHTISTLTAPSGLEGQNFLWHHGYFYHLASEKVYRHTTYSNLASLFYTPANGTRALFLHNDRVHIVSNRGEVFRVNATNDNMETVFTPVGTLDIRYATSYKGYILLVHRGPDGSLWLMRWSDSERFDVLARTIAISGDMATYGNPFTIYQDKLWFTTGKFTHTDGLTGIHFYTFNGSSVQKAAFLVFETSTPYTNIMSIGLLNWQDHLVAYVLQQAGANSQHAFHLLLPSQTFVKLGNPVTSAVQPFIPRAFAANNTIILSSDAGQNYTGIHQLDNSQTLEEGYVETAYLDMDLPGREKMLNRLTVIMDRAAANFKVTIKYRKDDTAAWTTAVTGNNTRRISADNLKQVFYTLQVRVEIDDDSGNDVDYRLDAISILYSVSD